MKLYFAASLFSRSERTWNRQLAEALKQRIPGLDLTLPQDYECSDEFDAGEIFMMCIEGIDLADMVLAILDGAEPDSGTCFEVGYARGLGKPIIGIRTDYRKNQDRGLNVMLANGVDQLVREYSFGEDIGQLAKDVAGKILRVRKLGGH